MRKKTSHTFMVPELFALTQPCPWNRTISAWELLKELFENYRTNCNEYRRDINRTISLSGSVVGKEKEWSHSLSLPNVGFSHLELADVNVAALERVQRSPASITCQGFEGDGFAKRSASAKFELVFPQLFTPTRKGNNMVRPYRTIAKLRDVRHQEFPEMR